MATPVYDKERSDEELRKLTGIDANKERLIDEAAHNAHSGQELQQLENNQSPGAYKNDNTPKGLANSEQAADTVGRGYQGGQERAQDQKGRGKRGGLLRRSLRLLTKNKKRTIGGLAVISFIIILLLSFSGFSVFELINMRENLLGHGNRFTNSVLQNRRATSLGRLLRTLHTENGKIADMDEAKFATAFRKQGFKVEFDEEGKLKEFSFKNSAGDDIHFNLNDEDNVRATNDFFGNKDFGRSASKAYDKAMNSVGRFWTGDGFKSVASRYRFKLYEWLNRKPSEEATTPRQELADNLRNADTEQSVSETTGKTVAQLEAENTVLDEHGNPIRSEAYDSLEAMAGKFNGDITPEEYADKLRADPTADDSVIGVASNENVETLANNTSDALKDVDNINVDKVAPEVFKGSILGTLNAVSVAQDSCQLKGVMNFIANARNVLFAVELARFSLRMMNAADDQKAGILSSTGLNMLMIWLHTPDPKTGHTYLYPMQNYTGDGSIMPSSFYRALYGTGRNFPGVLGGINKFLNGIPGADHCKVVNNGFVTVGGFVVGGVATVLSGGGVNVASLAIHTALAISKEVVIQVATPMLIKSAAGMALNGLDESGGMAGAAWGSGFGVLSGMVASANGLRPSTVDQVVGMTPSVDQAEQQDIADQSLYNRYLNPAYSQSLVSHVAMAMPDGLSSLAITIRTGTINLFNNITSFGALRFILPGKASADTNVWKQCDDPQIKRLNIAARPDCSIIFAQAPNLDLKQTEDILRANGQIDDQGNPTETKYGDGKSFKEFVDDCFSGRPGILYNANIDMEGNESVNDDTCTQPGVRLNGDTIGKYDRFAAWYGYKADVKDLTDKISHTAQPENTVIKKEIQ